MEECNKENTFWITTYHDITKMSINRDTHQCSGHVVMKIHHLLLQLTWCV
uniref:Uncharacterized protein n=1 Tax=Arion vulgaris TaxID=1028688 RepID=A0A0B6Z5U3_9EUPU